MRSPEEDIKAFIRRLASPTDDELDAFIAGGRRAFIARGEPVCRIGDAQHRLAFLHTGILRFHVFAPRAGEDVTKDFCFAPGFAASFGSAVQGRPAAVAISAVDDCAVTLWPFEVLDALFDRGVEWERFGRKNAEWLYVRKEKRELAFLLQSAPERYEAALAEFPPDIARIPQNVLASYLGIAPESLSRLKRKLGR